MPALPAAPLLLLLSMGGANTLPVENWDTGVRRLELQADAPVEMPRVRVSPGRTSVFTFDTPVRRVEVPGQERWRPSQSEDGRTLIVKPAGEVSAGEEVMLSVFFEDGAAPDRVRLLLVVHPDGPEEVEVYRHPRTLESFRLGEREQRARAEQCEVELAHVQAERGGPGGLTALVEAQVVNAEGVRAEDITRFLTEHPANALRLSQAFAYRANRRVLLVLVLLNEGTEAWNAVNASLVGKGGGKLKMLSVWQRAPIAPSDLRPPWVYVEAELPPEAQGTYTLRLWAEGGTRVVILRGVPLP
jgi:uncharacterized protein (TIGR02268 family)